MQLASSSSESSVSSSSGSSGTSTSSYQSSDSGISSLGSLYKNSTAGRLPSTNGSCGSLEDLVVEVDAASDSSPQVHLLAKDDEFDLGD